MYTWGVRQTACINILARSLEIDVERLTGAHCLQRSYRRSLSYSGARSRAAKSLSTMSKHLYRVAVVEYLIRKQCRARLHIIVLYEHKQYYSKIAYVVLNNLIKLS